MARHKINIRKGSPTYVMNGLKYSYTVIWRPPVGWGKVT